MCVMLSVYVDSGFIYLYKVIQVLNSSHFLEFYNGDFRSVF